MKIFYTRKAFTLLFICCLSSLTIFARFTPGQISFSASAWQSTYRDCNATVTTIYNYFSPAGGSGQYLFTWERKVGANRDWVVIDGALPTNEATVQQNEFVYYRRKVKDKNNTNDSAYSNEIYTFSYAANHGAIRFEDGTYQSTAAVGALPPRIVNETLGSVTNPPIRYQFERKTGINGIWERVSNYNTSDAAPYQPPSPANTTDTIYYRRYVSDAFCGSIPGGTVPVSVVGTGSALPVNWIYAAVVRQNNSIEVQWKVANEFNNSHFEIYRSNDGFSFTKIGTVASKGNSSSAVSYMFDDRQGNTSGTTSYYRIKQVDKDSKFNLSPVLQIKPNKNNLLELLPNPVTTVTTLKAGNIIKHVSITDLTGRVIYSSVNYSSTLLVDATLYAKGIYILKVWLVNDEVKTIRMVKQ